MNLLFGNYALAACASQLVNNWELQRKHNLIC